MFQVRKTKGECKDHVWGFLEVTTVSTTGEKSAYTIKQCKKCFKVIEDTVKNDKQFIKHEN